MGRARMDDRSSIMGRPELHERLVVGTLGWGMCDVLELLPARPVADRVRAWAPRLGGCTVSSLTFEVLGLPAAQGSKRHVGNGVMVEQNANVKPWRTDVAAIARDIANGTVGAPLDGPLSLTVEFRFPMPKSRRKAVREAGRAPKVSAPDLDKCVRSTCDALEASGLITNDERIVSVCASKVEVTDWTGAVITIEDVEWGE